MLRILGRYCGSTALTLSMHTHPLATLVWRWRRDPAPVERILRRVADERLQLVTSGASDWLDGSGVAVRVEDGWRITARKMFRERQSGRRPADDHGCGYGIRTGTRCAAFRASAGGRRCDGHGQLAHSWACAALDRMMSIIEDVHVPEAAISMRRPPGKWVPPLATDADHRIAASASAVISAWPRRCVTVLVAMAAKRADTAEVVDIVGEMDTELASARIAHRDMVDAAFTLDPGCRYVEPRLHRSHSCGTRCSARRRTRNGGSRRRRILPGGRTGAAVPRYPGGALSPAAGENAAPIQWRVGTWSEA